MVGERLALLSTEITQLFLSQSHEHSRRCAVLVALDEWREQGFLRVMAALPELSSLRAQAKKQVDQKVLDAREAVMSSVGDQDMAEATLQELGVLAGAYSELDFGQTAAVTLSDLKHNLELRSVSLDETLRTSLEEGRFEYVKDFIKPLIGKKDALKRDKVNRVLNGAKEMLLDRFAVAERGVGNASMVAQAVRMLANADEHIGKQLLELQSFDAQKSAETLRSCIAAFLTRSVEKLEVPLAALNYAQIFEHAALLGEYLTEVEPVIVAGTRPAKRSRGQQRDEVADIVKRARSMVQKARTCLNDVDRSVSGFVAGLKAMVAGGQGEQAGPLVNMLNKLKVAADIAGSTDESGIQTLMTCYQRWTRDLSQELVDTLQRVKLRAENERLFTMAIDVCAYVNRELTLGLKHHVTLEVDFERELVHFRSLDESATEKLKSSCLTIQEIDLHVCPLLVSLKSKSYVWWNRQYNQQRKVFNSQVASMLQSTDAAALQQKKYGLAGQTAAVLQHIFGKAALKPHLDAPLGQQWMKLGRSICAEAGHLSEKIKGALTSDNLHNLENLLRRLHEFEGGLFRIYTEKLKPLAQDVHRAMGDWVSQKVEELSTQLENFQLGNVADSVVLLRRAGTVLVSTFTLYIELAEESKRHSVRDHALARLQQLCSTNFAGEAASKIGIHYALLELEPNATKKDVGKAYKVMCLKYHPDKQQGTGLDEKVATAMMQRVGEAKSQLEQDHVRTRFKHLIDQPFAKTIVAVPKEMLLRVRGFLEEHEYDKVCVHTPFPRRNCMPARCRHAAPLTAL